VFRPNRQVRQRRKQTSPSLLSRGQPLPAALSATEATKIETTAPLTQRDVPSSTKPAWNWRRITRASLASEYRTASHPPYVFDAAPRTRCELKGVARAANTFLDPNDHGPLHAGGYAHETWRTRRRGLSALATGCQDLNASRVRDGAKQKNAAWIGFCRNRGRPRVWYLLVPSCIHGCAR